MFDRLNDCNVVKESPGDGFYADALLLVAYPSKCKLPGEAKYAALNDGLVATQPFIDHTGARTAEFMMQHPDNSPRI